MTKILKRSLFFFGCIATILLMGCQSFFYYPSKEKLFDPARIKMKQEDVYLQTASGEKIHGWYFASAQKETKGTVLFFHGNAENLSSHFLMFHWLPEQGYSYFIFDYPGYGESSGKPTPQGTVEAGIAAAEWLHKKESRPLIVYGHSLGGIVALRTAQEIKGRIPVRDIVVEASFGSYKQMGRNVLKRHWLTWIFQPLTYVVLSDAYAPEPIHTLAPIPMLFIAGTEDRAVEAFNTQALYDQAQNPKEIWMVSGGRHGDLYVLRNGELRKQLLSYLSKDLTVAR